MDGSGLVSWIGTARAPVMWLVRRVSRKGSRWGEPFHVQRFAYGRVRHLRAIEPSGAWRGPRVGVVQWMEDLTVKYWDRRVEVVGRVVIQVGPPERETTDIVVRGKLEMRADWIPGEALARGRYRLVDSIEIAEREPLSLSGVILLKLINREHVVASTRVMGTWMSPDLVSEDGMNQPPPGTIAIGDFEASTHLRSAEEAKQPVEE